MQDNALSKEDLMFEETKRTKITEPRNHHQLVKIAK